MAQSGPEDEIELDEIEAYLESDEQTVQRARARSLQPAKKKETTIADLANLAPFSDIAVIQKRYLMKTERFEIFAGGTALMNDAFFNNMGGVLKLGYYFSEKWGVEGSLFVLSSKEKEVTQSLSDRGVVTNSLVTPKGFYGADIKWVPIYGKMAFFDNRIVPFDLYFSVGFGFTQSDVEDDSGNAGTSSSPTFKVGTGQKFAISKSFAFRWDFSWHFFKPDVVLEEGQESNFNGTFNNLFLLVGFSYFLPESRL